MLLILICSFSFNVLFAVATEKTQKSVHDYATTRTLSSSRKATGYHPAYNLTYIDKNENDVRVPNLNLFNEHTNKRKAPKKSPKRTIQKIIKKTKLRKKQYLNQATILPTKAPQFNDLDKFYAQEEMLQRNENLNTTQANQNKRKKKWNHKITRYPMPFQNLASKLEHKRNKRSDDREDVFILTDLDEIEFLNNDKEDNVVRAHIKKYW